MHSEFMTFTGLRHFPAARALELALALAMGCAALALVGCATPPPPEPPAPKVEVPPERIAAPGEAALAQGIKQYQAAQYVEAEAQLKLALQQGLMVGPDRAAAHKYLAFIYCTSKREGLCAAAFKSARQADPAFVLSKSEAGHPVWGKVYRKVVPTP
jgi:Tfp pilus assembly protein PilF